LIRRRCSSASWTTSKPNWITNDTDWSAVQPLVQKVLDARRDVGVGGGMRALFGRNRGGNNNNGGGNNPGRVDSAANPARSRMPAKALDDNAPASQIKDLARQIQGFKESQTGQARKPPRPT